MKTKTLHADVAVIGAGAAGVAAAVAAASSGAEVVLVERQCFPGGSATAAMVGTVCGLYLSQPGEQAQWAVGGFARKFAEDLQRESSSHPEKFYERLHFLPYRIKAFKKVCNQLLVDHKVTCLWHTTIRAVEHHEGRIQSLLLHDGEAEINLLADQVVDCSGDSWVSRLANPDWVKGDENQAAARVFTLCGISEMPAEAIHFALSLSLRRGVMQGKISDALALLTVVPGSYREGCAYFKLPLPEAVSNDPDQRREMLHSSEKSVREVVRFLRENAKAFADVEITELAPEVGFRSGFLPEGREELTEEIVIEARKSPDGIANGAWPIEYWKPGKQAEMAFFDDGDFYQIPAGCVESHHAKNLYFAGRNIAASARALASARVMGICLQTGYAAGSLAAGSAQGKPRLEVIENIRRELEL